jgi:hypothetical protein
MNQNMKKFLLTTAMVCALVSPVMSAQDGQHDKFLREEAAKQKENSQSQQGSTGIPQGANPFDYLPTEDTHKIFEEASDKDHQTARNIMSVDKYANDVMHMGDENSLVEKAKREVQKQEEKDQEVAKSVTKVSGAIIFKDNPGEVTDRALAIALEKKAGYFITISLANCVNLKNPSILKTQTDIMSLNLWKCKGITDFSFLQGMTGLKILSVFECPNFTDKDFSSIINLKKLFNLNCKGCSVTEEKIIEFSIKLPNCEIRSNFGTFKNGERI